MTVNDIKKIAKLAVSNLSCDISGICMYSAELICEKIVEKDFFDFYVIEGKVSMPNSLNPTQHSWIELYDGTIIDPTVSKFPIGTKRINENFKKYSPIQYLNLKKQIKGYDTLKYSLENEINEIANCIFEDNKDKKLDIKKDSSKKDDAKQDSSKKLPNDSPPLPTAAAGHGASIFGGDKENEPNSTEQDNMSGFEPGSDDDSKQKDTSEKNKITYYSDKVKESSRIKNERQQPEPGYKFEISDGGKYYIKNYFSKSNGGSILLAVPEIYTGNKDNISDIKFIKNFIMPKVNSAVKYALEQKKRTVLLGMNGLPYYRGKYSGDESGIIAKYLNEKYGYEYVIYDTWFPQEYSSFVGNDDVWQEVKKRTECKNLEIKSALYLYLLTTIHGRKFASKLRTENVLKTLESWHVDRNIVDDFNINNINAIFKVVYPEIFDSPETIVSYIIKTYLHVLRVQLLQKVMKYEKKGKIVIIPCDVNTSWALHDTFEKSNELIKPMKEKMPIAPETNQIEKPVPQNKKQ